MLARHFETGAEKYGSNNWLKGQPLSWFLDSACRHLVQYSSGETGERHDVAACWNLLALIETTERIRIGELPEELNDLGGTRAETQAQAQAATET